MLKPIPTLLRAAALAAALFCRPAAAAEVPANALLVVPSETAFDRKFQDFLDKRGARLLESHPPSVFVGHIPQELDKELEERFGAKVYRDSVDDWASFARYGEKAVFAVNAWNKRFLEDPPEAPLVISSRVQKTGRRHQGIKLAWNEVMKAGAYRLQISRSGEFDPVYLETLVPENEYTLYPFFLADGVYYWRVAALLRLNTGEAAEQPYSPVYNFAVSNPAAAGEKRPAPPPFEKARLRKGVLAWPHSPGDRYFRLQLSDTKNFEAPLADVFTDTCAYRLSGLPLDQERRYYMRVMGSDGSAPGAWSAPAEVPAEPRRGPAGRKKKR